MLFRFSCFNTHYQSHKQKKIVHLSTNAMQKMLEDSSHTEALNNITCLPTANSSNLKVELDTVESCADCTTDIRDIEGNPNSNSDDDGSNRDISVLKGIHMKKSESLGTGLDMKGMDSGGSASDDGIDQQFSCNESHDNCESLVPIGGNYSWTSQLDQFQEANLSESLHVHGDVGNNGSTFSVGDAPLSEKDSHEKLNDAQLYGVDHTAPTPVFEKSRSLPNIASPGHFTAYSVRRIRSAEDLNVMGSRRKEMLTHLVGPQAPQHDERTNTVITNDYRNHSDDPVDDSCITYNYVGSAKDWIVPVGDELDVNDNHGGDFSFHQKDESPGKDFKVKRIEEWVVDLQHCRHLEESGELSASDDHAVPTVRSILDVYPATKVEGIFSPGMEAVKKYISSLSPAATAAQLVNYRLAVIPFLSPFSSLRALNLSGNAIVRITAGSLPRGLHILNLSKNKISTIEGLRELARLRVLDLSYNRILRIGHGLASCSSLKELYLAGNKISEVEGLHRLLKLSALDLRFNKISTTKCLGQLAANYNSLQAISLEGNPAQKNVGDEQVKKYLQGLLPHLTYLNRQPIKAGTLKVAADRSARLGISAHQMDRGLKADHKLMRKGTHGTTSKVASSSLTHGRRSQATASVKPSKGKNGRLPPIGAKPAAQQNHLFDLSGQVSSSFRPDLSIRRSRSEGTLAAL